MYLHLIQTTIKAQNIFAVLQVLMLGCICFSWKRKWKCFAKISEKYREKTYRKYFFFTESDRCMKRYVVNQPWSYTFMFTLDAFLKTIGNVKITLINYVIKWEDLIPISFLTFKYNKFCFEVQYVIKGCNKTAWNVGSSFIFEGRIEWK